MSKKFEINIKTIMSGAGITKVIKGLDTGIRRAKAFGAAMRKGMHSRPVRVLRNAIGFLIGTLAAGTMQAAKFNIELARAWTMSSKGEGWFKEMRNSLRELSAELGVATDQLSGGLYSALSAGVPEENALSFLSTAAKIAVADGSDVAVAVDGMTTVLNAFKIEASETEAVADQMFNTVANGKTTFAELAQSLATVAPIAAANGVAFEEVLAAVATLTKQGTPTAQAMTQIRAAIVGANKALGDGWAKSMSLQEAFGKIEKKAKGSQTELQKMLGTIEGVQGVLGLTGINARMAADDLSSTADAAGRVDAAFQKVDQFRHWQKLWQGISGLVERTAQEADSRLAPAIAGIIEDIARIQSNDQLWAGLGDTLDEAQEKIKNIFEYIQSEGGEGAKEIVEALGQILLGHAQNGAQEAIAILAKWVPILGKEFGQATMDVVSKQFSDRKFAKSEAYSRAGEHLGPEPEGRKERKEYLKKRSKLAHDLEPEILENMKIGRAKLAGLDLQKQVGSGAGDANINDGKARLEKASITGEADGNARAAIKRIEAEVAAEMQNMQGSDLARKAAEDAVAWGNDWSQRQSALNQVRPLFRQQQQQQRDVESAAAPNRTGPSADAARASLDSERQQTAELIKLIQAVQDGDTSLIGQLVSSAEAAVQERAQLRQRVEQLAGQIKNGRS